MQIQSRVDKYNDMKRKSLKDLWLKIIIIIIALITTLFSVWIWFYLYKDFKISEIMFWLQTFYIMVIGVFITITSIKSYLFISSFRVLIKLCFSVWLIVFILLSSLQQLEQNIYVIFATFFVGYLEASLEFYFVVTDSFEKYEAQFLDKDFLKKLTVPFSIIMISLIHIVLSFLLLDIFGTIFF